MTGPYQTFFDKFDGPFLAATNAATDAGIAWAGSLVPAILIPVVIVCGILLATGQLGWGVVHKYSWRVVLLVWLTIGAAYGPNVRDMVVNTIPNELASAVNGGGNALTVVQQFDVIDDAISNFTARVLGQATGPFQVGNAIAAWVGQFFAKISIEIIFFLFLSFRLMTYLVVCLGAFCVVFIPFDSTRGFFIQILGKMVSLIIWQLSASILLSIILEAMRANLRNFMQMGTNASIEAQVNQIFSIAGTNLGCLLLMIIIPAACGVGCGYMASAVQGSAFSETRMAAGAASAMTRASHSMRQAAGAMRRR